MLTAQEARSMSPAMWEFHSAIVQCIESKTYGTYPWLNFHPTPEEIEQIKSVGYVVEEDEYGLLFVGFLEK
jgi:hypothetical protein